MYAIIEDGAHQYKVEQGIILDVQRRDLAEDQSTVEFDRVVLIGGGEERKIGRPYVAGAKVTATVEQELKGEKIHTIKFRRRKGYRRKIGHRQSYLRVRVEKIEF